MTQKKLFKNVTIDAIINYVSDVQATKLTTLRSFILKKVLAINILISDILKSANWYLEAAQIKYLFTMKNTKK